MTKQQILNHFHNGDVVECLITGNEAMFNDKNLKLVADKWVLYFPQTLSYICLEKDGQLATIIQPDKTEVYAQLGKEVEAILDKETNYAIRGEKISRLYER